MSKHIAKHKSRRLRRFLKANEAVSALEYAILVGVVAVAIGAAIVTFSDNLKTALTQMGDQVDNITLDTSKGVGIKANT